MRLSISLLVILMHVGFSAYATDNDCYATYEKVAQPKASDLRKVIQCLEERIAALERLVVPSAPQAAPPRHTVIGTPPVVEMEGFTFNDAHCRKRGTTMTCTVAFKNHGREDRQLTILGKNYGHTNSALYDSDGNKFGASIRIGNQKAAPHSIKQTFVPDFKTRVHFVADAVNTESRFVNLAISIYQFKNDVAIKNIPIMK